MSDSLFLAVKECPLVSDIMLITKYSQLQQQNKTSPSLWPPCSRKTRTHRSFPLAAEKWSNVHPLASRILGEYPCSSILRTVQTSPAATAAWICSSSWSSGFLLQWWFSILSHFRKGKFTCVSGVVSASFTKGSNLSAMIWKCFIHYMFFVLSTVWTRLYYSYYATDYMDKKAQGKQLFSKWHSKIITIKKSNLSYHVFMVFIPR